MLALDTLFSRSEYHIQKHNLMRAAVQHLHSYKHHVEGLWQRVFVRYAEGFPEFTEPRERYLEKIAQIADSHQDRAEKAMCYREYGIGQMNANHLELALSALEKSLVLFRELEDRFDIAHTLHLMGLVYRGISYDKSRACYLEAKTLVDALGGPDFAIDLLLDLAFVEKNPELIRQYGQETLRLSSEGSSLMSFIRVRQHLAWEALLRGKLEAVRTLVQPILDVVEKNDGLTGPLARVYPIMLMSFVKSAADADFQTGLKLGMQAELVDRTVWGKAVAGWSIADALCGLGRFKDSLKHIIKYLAFFAQDLNCRLQSCAVVALNLSGTGYHEKAAEYPGLCCEKDNTDWLLKSALGLEKQQISKREAGENVYNAAWERGKTLDLDKVVKQLLDEFSE